MVWGLCYRIVGIGFELQVSDDRTVGVGIGLSFSNRALKNESSGSMWLISWYDLQRTAFDLDVPKT